jgi:hypothetical protein
LSKKKLIKGSKIKVKGISEQGISRTSIHGKIWQIERVVSDLSEFYSSKGPLIALKSCSERNACFWFYYKEDPHFKITKFLG